MLEEIKWNVVLFYSCGRRIRKRNRGSGTSDGHAQLKLLNEMLASLFSLFDTADARSEAMS